MTTKELMQIFADSLTPVIKKLKMVGGAKDKDQEAIIWSIGYLEGLAGVELTQDK